MLVGLSEVRYAVTYGLAAQLHCHFVIMSASADSRQHLSTSTSRGSSPPESSRKGLTDISESSRLPGALMAVMSAISRLCCANGMKGSTPSTLHRVLRSVSNPAPTSAVAQLPPMSAGTPWTVTVGAVPARASVLTSRIAGSSTTNTVVPTGQGS
ncbi:hypothetical protein A5746_23720 [Mycolicibacterium conceptionense]|uniref:Uncharacterized protein n=1 Tax=Mycolicibacterium conceptionense TaxID=451644 RepID=A0ABX3UZP8_9MYCO|nr:hypothetical protein A5639_25065 [Mycolicibacterium conceptionense]OMB88962.1 hypothetical protein A5746_23720 [Mycolicibacterium conceptionense]ORV20517.1 hypothetical protein AWB98_29040 [Mycolicibacterium conceptionense]